MVSKSSTLLKVTKPRWSLRYYDAAEGSIAGDSTSQLDEHEALSMRQVTQAPSLEKVERDVVQTSTTLDGPLESLTRRAKRPLGDDYTPTVNPYHQSITLLARSSSVVCNADNPLRALLRYSTEAQGFCPSFLKADIKSGQLPNFVSPYGPADVSSACSCFEMSVGCCTPTISTVPTEQQTTAEQSYMTPSSQFETANSPSRTLASLTSSPDPATEDATFSRPSEYSSNYPTSEITITATWQGPTSVPDPSTSDRPAPCKLCGKPAHFLNYSSGTKFDDLSNVYPSQRAGHHCVGYEGTIDGYCWISGGGQSFCMVWWWRHVVTGGSCHSGESICKPIALELGDPKED